jgi:ribosomal protein L17
MKKTTKKASENKKTTKKTPTAKKTTKKVSKAKTITKTVKKTSTTPQHQRSIIIKGHKPDVATQNSADLSVYALDAYMQEISKEELEKLIENLSDYYNNIKL